MHGLPVRWHPASTLFRQSLVGSLGCARYASLSANWEMQNIPGSLNGTVHNTGQRCATKGAAAPDESASQNIPQINPENFRLGVFICVVDCPHACSGTDIEDTVNLFFVKGSLVKRIVRTEDDKFMDDIKPRFLFNTPQCFLKSMPLPFLLVLLVPLLVSLIPAYAGCHSYLIRRHGILIGPIVAMVPSALEPGIR